MSKRYLTLMIIPHNEDRVRELNISRPFIWGLCGALALCFCALIFYAFGYYLQLNQEVHLAVLETENAELKHQLGRFQKRMKGLRGQIEELTDTDRMMRAWVSFTEPGEEVRRMGVGGEEVQSPPWDTRVSYATSQSLTNTYTDLDQIIREAAFLKTSFDSIAAYLQHDELKRRHMPSILPIPDGVECWRSSPFGYRIDPFTGQREFHNGLDIAGRQGTPIIATADGVIDKVMKDKYLGYYVAISHGSGVRTIYGHLMGRPSGLRKGQRVKRGDQIGSMGQSGRATAPHVHYSVIIKKRAVEPMRYIFEGRKALSAIY